MRLSPTLLLPAVTLVAQAPAPAPANLAQVFNTELPAVTQLLKELKAPEALAKAQALIPAQRPTLGAASPQQIVQGVDNARGLMSLYALWAKVAGEAGQWEKAVEIQEKRASEARAILQELDQAQAPLANQWRKVAKDSGDYTAKNTPRLAELQAELKSIQDEVAAVNSKQKKLDGKGMEALKARIATTGAMEQEVAQINASLPVHKQNLANAPKVQKFLNDNRKDVESLITTADEALAKIKKTVAEQNQEIAQFNTSQILKKAKVQGKKTWVDAVLRDKENVTKQPTPQEQAAFLSRMLVLDPGNAVAEKALANLKAGKEPFPKETKPAKKAGAKK